MGDPRSRLRQGVEIVTEQDFRINGLDDLGDGAGLAELNAKWVTGSIVLGRNRKEVIGEGHSTKVENLSDFRRTAERDTRSCRIHSDADCVARSRCPRTIAHCLRTLDPPVAGDRRCPMCGGEGLRLWMARDWNRGRTEVAFYYLQCRTCRTTYLRTIPEDLDRYYEDAYHRLPATTEESQALAVPEQFKLDAIGTLPGGARLLDVGSSFGVFAYLARRAGFAVDAVEPDPECGSILADLVGVRVFRDIQAPGLDRSATDDAVTLWQVFEHVPDPRRCWLESWSASSRRNSDLRDTEFRLDPGAAVRSAMDSSRRSQAPAARPNAGTCRAGCGERVRVRAPHDDGHGEPRLELIWLA